MLDSPDTSTAALAEDLRGLIGKLKRRLRAQSHLGDLSWSQIAILSRLERDGPATVTTLARNEGVRPQSMGATMAAFQGAGYVVAMPDPDDGRQTLLSVSDTCRQMVHTVRAARQDWLLSAIQKTLTPDEQTELARATALLKRVVEA